MEFLFNHLGFKSGGTKKAVFQTEKQIENIRFSILDASDHSNVFKPLLKDSGPVKGWKARYFYVLNFSDFSDPGKYLPVSPEASHQPPWTSVDPSLPP